MNLIFLIAWRNIFRHKGKTLVIGTILFLGALIMTLGNGMISGLNKGLEKHIINSFSGHIVLISEKQKEQSVLLSMTGQTIEPINNFKDIKNKIADFPYIKGILPAGIGYVWVLNNAGQPMDQYILGVDFPAYFQFFEENVKAVDGRLLQDKERGVLVSTVMQKMLYDFSNFWVMAKNTTLNVESLTKEAKENINNLDLRKDIVFMGLSRKNSSLDIRTDVYGIIKFKSLNSILGFYSILDIESLRECMGYFTADNSEKDITAEQKKLIVLDDMALDSMFETSFSVAEEAKSNIFKPDFKVVKKLEKHLDLEEGVYNIVFVKLNEGIFLDEAITKLNKFSKENNLGFKAIKWNTAIGPIGQIALIMKTVLFVFVAFIFFVAIIIIMNTLSMAAMERISEIGMMRAVGARKWFIARMFLAETFLLSAAFGGVGIVVGIIAIKIIAALHITTTNEVLQIFYGGDMFNPMISFGGIFLCALQLIVVTFLAVVYPIIVARRITALDAIVKD